MGVDLGRGDVRVAEQLLHRPQVPARLEEMARERVTQGVRVDHRAEPQLAGPPLHHALDTARPEALAPAPHEHRRLGGGDQGPARFEPPRQRLAGEAPHGHDPLLASLAHHVDRPLPEVQPLQVEPHQLGETQPRGIEQLEDRPVPNGQRVAAGGRLDEACHLVGVERLGQAARGLRGSHPHRGVAPCGALADQEPIEGPDRRQGPLDARAARPVPVPPGGEPAHVLVVQGVPAWEAPVRPVPRQVREVAPVGPRGAGRETPLLQEVAFEARRPGVTLGPRQRRGPIHPFPGDRHAHGRGTAEASGPVPSSACPASPAGAWSAGRRRKRCITSRATSASWRRKVVAMPGW